MPSSNRLKLLIVAIIIALGKEIAAHNGIEIPMETFLTIEGLILGLMGLDTARPMGRGYPPAVCDKFGNSLPREPESLVKAEPTDEVPAE